MLIIDANSFYLSPDTHGISTICIQIFICIYDDMFRYIVRCLYMYVYMHVLWVNLLCAYIELGHHQRINKQGHDNYVLW